MRVSEPLLHATWENVDWARCILRLQDGKVGARDVPLNPGAMEVLRVLETMATERDDPKIIPITYEALRAAWNRACESAGVKGVHIHDLRHTAATRFTLELHGNLPVLKVITGHKTFSQLSRYINVKPADVSRLLHGRPLTEAEAPAGLHLKPLHLANAAPPAQSWDPASLPANVVPIIRPTR